MIEGQVAEVSLSANDSLLAAGLRRAMNLMKGFATGASYSMSKLNLAPKDPKKGQSWLGVKGGQLAGAAAMSGIDWMVEQGKAVFDFEDQLTRFGIANRKAGSDLRAIGAAARKTSTDIGLDAREVLAAASAYTALAGAENFTIAKMNILSRAAQASHASTGDLAGMMYQLTNSMKITDDQMEDTIGGLINQAKDGAIEAKQMAKEFSSLLPLFARFKDSTGREGALQVGALFQVVRDNFNSADEAGTGLIRVLAGLRTYASRFEKHGIKIWNIDKDGHKKAREFSAIFADIAKSDLMKDPEKLKKAFGRTEGWRAFEILAENVPKLRQLEESGRRNGVIMEDLGTYTTSAGGRMKIAVEKMKNAFAEALTPERVGQIVSGIEQMTAAMGPLMRVVGGVAGAFDKFLRGVARAKQWTMGSIDSPMSNDEAMFRGQVRDAELGRQGGYVHMSSGSYRYDSAQVKAELARYDAIKAERDRANAVRGELVDAEDAFGPTDEAVKKAIRYAKAGMVQEGPAGETEAQASERRARSSAALWYLEQRKGDINEARYKRIERELEGEAAARADAEKKAAEKKATIEALQNLKPAWLPEFANMLGAIINTGKPVAIQVDGNTIAKADSNATDKRRK